MDHTTALALMHNCRAAGLDAWYGRVGELYVVCCRPAPGHPPVWLTSHEDAARRLPELVRSLDETWTGKPGQADAGAPDRDASIARLSLYGRYKRLQKVGPEEAP